MIVNFIGIDILSTLENLTILTLSLKYMTNNTNILIY